MRIKKLAMAFGIAVVGLVSSGNDTIVCNIESLEAHSFSQLGDTPEYVCVSIIDRTDFVIVEDVEGEMGYHDLYVVSLNEYDEVIKQSKLK